MRTNKPARIMFNVRITADDRELIRQAAARHGMTIEALAVRAFRIVAMSRDIEHLVAIERAAKRAGGKA